MKAMILAAGRGERMGVLTAERPKPLLAVAGMPLIEHHLRRLQTAGFREIVINTSYLGEQIRAALGNGERWGVSIQFTIEPERLDSGGGIYNALPLLGAAPFLLVNGDVWTDVPLQTLRLAEDRWAHLVMVPNPDHHPRGDFVLADNGLMHASGSEAGSEAKRFTYSGISVLSPRLFSDCSSGIFPLAPLLRNAMQQGRVSGECYFGQWIDVGTPERLILANQVAAQSPVVQALASH